MVEFSVITKVVKFAEPPDGTDPVPVQPVQTQTVLPSVTGFETLQVTEEALS
jgi:hypothetical protein